METHQLLQGLSAKLNIVLMFVWLWLGIAFYLNRQRIAGILIVCGALGAMAAWLIISILWEPSAAFAIAYESASAISLIALIGGFSWLALSLRK